ncbi:Hypothetical predicted protein [Pelobates cultripes]|uniref:Uncharacterized protein n=1 Tax=Pelobates cultripes TaxID=61616 RepID=A0AAD1TEH8_PELCU|nr:Hypothetical predicted protein [Pelobates cultripes]
MNEGTRRKENTKVQLHSKLQNIKQKEDKDYKKIKKKKRETTLDPLTQLNIYLKQSSRFYEMSREQMEGVVRTVETLLGEAETLRARCQRQSDEVRQLCEDLRNENRELTERFGQAEKDLVEVKRCVNELMDTKVAFEVRERQVRKLSKQL